MPRSFAPPIDATCPAPLLHAPAPFDGKDYIYSDGSFEGATDEEPAECGWGFCFLPCTGGEIIDHDGPVDLLDDGLPLSGLHKTHTISNNVGELCAVLHSLIWISNLPQPPKEIGLAYDNEYSRRVTTGEWRCQSNYALVLQCRRGLSVVRGMISISWHKVAAHTNDVFNDRADALAKYGRTHRKYTRGVYTLRSP